MTRHSGRCSERGGGLLGIGLVVVGLAGGCVAATGAEEAPPSRSIAAKGAIRPATPKLPATVVADMQEGRYDAADEALGRLAGEAGAADRAYYDLLRGVARRLGSHNDAAREVLAAALRAAPKGPWAAKIRSELAAIELATGRADAAEALARADAESLLASDRKDRLAEVYHAFARRLLKPDDPVTPADPNAAYDLLAQARGLAKGADLRARLLVAMARASRAAGNHGRAINDLQTYLKEVPDAPVHINSRAEARFLLGESQRDAGQKVEARLTWGDLARDLAAAHRPPRDRDGPRTQAQGEERDDLRARALYQIASTYGVPTPPDDNSLALGVAALRRFLEANPAHPLAVPAAAEIADSYLARGKTQEALEALTAFLKRDGDGADDEATRRDRSRRIMAATFQRAQLLQGQEQFAEAIAAWEGYLARFPDGPQSADAHRAVLDTQLMIAADHLARDRFDEARAAWQGFVARNPLDPRVPGVLFQVGESVASQHRPDAAIAAWEPLLGKFPDSEPAAHAQFLIASIHEREKGEPAVAIEQFRRIKTDPWRSQALQRVAAMEAKALTVITPRAFRTGEPARLRITSRNLPKLTFAAYKLDAEAYFRKKHALDGIEALDISLVRPDAGWSVDVPDYARYRPLEQDYELKGLKLPGAYVVKVSDETTLQATTLVLGTDIDAIVKASREQVLVFAQDMVTGRGRPGARVLVCDGESVVLEARTGADGVLLRAWDQPRQASAPLRYLVVDGASVAGSGLGVPERVSQGLSPRAAIDTDRPAYRPGQSVSLRGVVREVEGGQYVATEGAEYRLEVTDPRGRSIVARPVRLSAFGTFHDAFPLDPGAALGTYRVRVYRPSKSEFSGQFEVQAYQLRKLDLTLVPNRTVFFRGETVEVKAVARYQYGAPASGRPVAVQLPDGRTLRGTTDGAGQFAFSFATEGFAEEQALPIVAQLPQDGVAAATRVMVAVRGFTLAVATARDVYLDGETFPLDVTAEDVQGGPAGQALAVAVLKVTEQAGRQAEREVRRLELRTDPKTGKGTVPVRIDDPRGGRYVLRVSGTDRFGNPVVSDRTLNISGRDDETRLRLLSDHPSYKVGEEAEVNLHSRGAGGTALLTWEADRILEYRLLPLHEGSNALSWEVSGAQFPNFTLTATRMAGTRFDESRLDIRVERDLRVTLTPARAAAGPGEPVEVTVETTDQLGRPVAAEVAVALVDEALLRLFEGSRKPIGAFFHDQTRTGAFATQATNTFRYAPATMAVSEAVVEEMERSVEQAGDKAELGSAIAQARRGAIAAAPPPPAAAPSAPAPASDLAAAVDSTNMRLDKSKVMMRYGDESRDRKLAEAGKPLGEAKQALGRSGGNRGEKNGKLGDAMGLMIASDAESAVGGDGSTQLFYDVLGGGPAVAYGGGRWGAPSSPRQQFVETAYWNPAVVTDAKGKATITVKAPLALSRYRFNARGVSASDTLVGQTTAALDVRKDLFVDLKVPATLTEGDRPRFLATIHHEGVRGKVAVALSLYAGGRETRHQTVVDLKADGNDEFLFEPYEVPDADELRLTLTATAGARRDDLVLERPIRPWGVQAFASASGTSSGEATAFLALPAGRGYDDPEMLIVLSPSLSRMIVELALGREVLPLEARADRCLFPPPPPTTSDRAGDLLAAAEALAYLRATRGAEAAEADRLSDRIRSVASELISLQNEDGGWPWAVAAKAVNPAAPRPSDRATSARVAWSLAAAAPVGLLPDPKALDRAAAYLAGQVASAADPDTRALLLHGLSVLGKATFEQVNALNRSRQGLSDAALAYLALALAHLDRAAMAGEVLDVLAGRARSEAAGVGRPALAYWEGQSPLPFNRGAVEATALATLAFAAARPEADLVKRGADWLLAHRQGTGWASPKAAGPALAALAVYQRRAAHADDRYRLVATVNDVEVARLDVQATTRGQALLVPRKALKPGAANRVRLRLEGRGTFAYAVTLTGFTRDLKPDQNWAGRTAIIQRRAYFPADPELDGKALPTGFSVALNANGFENLATQVSLGGRARVQIDTARTISGTLPEWARDALVVEEHLPAGTTLIEGSVQSNAGSYSQNDDVLTFYFAPDQWPGSIRYDVHGFLPGRYRALPASIRSAYEPGRSHLGAEGVLRVRDPGEASDDPYRPTPDELYARGKGEFDAGRLEAAALALEPLSAGYTLRDDVAKDSARMLLLIHIRHYQPRKVVQDFEVVKERVPEMVISFDDLGVIGRAYRDIGESERAFLVWRGAAEASYLEDAQVGEALRQRGRPLEAIAYLLDLWREYPDTPALETDLFGLSQVLAQLATEATANAATRHTLADAGITRPELLLQAIRTVQAFLARSPRSPMADEASLALVAAFLELGDDESVVKLASRFARLFPKSSFLDSFQYGEALGEFHLGHDDRAVTVAEAIAKATYRDAAGVDQPSPNRWQAIYILGQIFDARRNPARALDYYRQVVDRFSDAAGAVAWYTRQGLSLPEVTVVRPESRRPEAAAVKGEAGGVLRSIPPGPRDAKAGTQPGVALTYRNVAEVDVTVYPVDLLRLYLTRRNLDAIAGIDLAGITPLLERRIKLGDGADFEEKERRIDLDLPREGAYLVMVRGGSLYASGIVLLSPLELEVLEEAGSGRVRVTVRDAATKQQRRKVEVKVIGDGNSTFFTGETDQRGVFVAEGVQGAVTALARSGESQYAFYRGHTRIGPPPAVPNEPASASKPGANAPGKPAEALDANLKDLGNANQKRQIDRLQNRYKEGGQGGASARGFK